MPDTFNIGLGNNNFEIRQRSETDFVKFWGEESKKLSWFSLPEKTLQWNYPFAKWFEGGMINASYNALDIHQKTKPKKPAIIWEAESGESRILTYEELWVEVKKFSNALKSLGVSKGDRITIYLPMVPELPISMLACARIGATHTVVFSGFSSTSLRERIDDSKSKLVITSDGGYRRGKIVNLKEVVDEAIQDFDFVKNVIVLERTKQPIQLTSKDKLWSDLTQDISDDCEAEKLESLHPLHEPRPII